MLMKVTVELVVHELLCLELGQHHQQPLERGQVGEACHPEEVKVVGLEALLPPVGGLGLLGVGVTVRVGVRVRVRFGFGLELGLGLGLGLGLKPFYRSCTCS